VEYPLPAAYYKKAEAVKVWQQVYKAIFPYGNRSKYIIVKITSITNITFSTIILSFPRSIVARSEKHI
jgi:hypothetical protein